MSTALITHPDCFGHTPPRGHPESPARLEAVLVALSAPRFEGLVRVEAPMTIEEDILRCHTQAHLDRIKSSLPREGWIALDHDTFLSPGSYDAAMRAVGASCRGVEMVLAGEVRNAFSATRPPGHHAKADAQMGFCLLNNIAVATKRALDVHGLKRVALVDFDVHHGNGTQDILWDEPRALYVSTHQAPLYPWTGAAEETGLGNNILNVPMPAGAGSARYRELFDQKVVPALDAFKPELLLICAGFDGHELDHLARLGLNEDDFAWITHRLCDVADRHCGGKVVSVLSGGYNLQALSLSVAAHVGVLMERGA